MSTALVAEVRSKYPTPMTPEQCVRCSNEVAYRLNGMTANGPWGLRAKSSGTSWGGYALDVIVHRSGYGVDILVAAPDRSDPSWQDQIAAPAEGWDAVWSPVRLDWIPGPTPQPQPPPTGDIEARVAALEAALARVRAAL